jgi:CheY-like chemotaxis protein
VCSSDLNPDKGSTFWFTVRVAVSKNTVLPDRKEIIASGSEDNKEKSGVIINEKIKTEKQNQNEDQDQAEKQKKEQGKDSGMICQQAAASNDMPEYEGNRILIVEDNEINQLLIKKYMEKLGYVSQSVKNGREAVEILKQQTFDIVLMDLQMPEMSGIDATCAIRNPESGVLDSHIPIIAVTAHAMKEDREKCLEVGMNDYISKPLTLQTVKDVILKYLPS